MCHPDNGTQLMVNPTGMHASSISLEDQAANTALTTSIGRKRQRGTSWYSRFTPEQRDAYLQRNREYKKRRKSDVSGGNNAHDKTDWASCSNMQNIAGQSDNLLSQHTHMEAQEHIVSESEDTYLYRALLAKVRSMGLIAIATATSGIAASIMPGGRTAHSRFKIPINIQEDTERAFP
jgi:hypothetical protein